MKNTVENIAKRYLRLDTLEPRNSDQLDFKEQAVWNIKLALEEAYRAGEIAGLKRAIELSDTIIKRKVVVRDSKGNGLYEGEVCGVGPCGRPDGHSGPHLESHEASDGVTLHPLRKNE